MTHLIHPFSSVPEYELAAAWIIIFQVSLLLWSEKWNKIF
jgi:hypothetical protein